MKSGVYLSPDGEYIIEAWAVKIFDINTISIKYGEDVGEVSVFDKRAFEDGVFGNSWHFLGEL